MLVERKGTTSLDDVRDTNASTSFLDGGKAAALVTNEDEKGHQETDEWISVRLQDLVDNVFDKSSKWRNWNPVSNERSKIVSSPHYFVKVIETLLDTQQFTGLVARRPRRKSNKEMTMQTKREDGS